MPKSPKQKRLPPLFPIPAPYSLTIYPISLQNAASIAANPDASGQVKVDRALCLLYSGETSNALSALQAIVDEDPSNAIAWANLGLVYEITGSTESARDAYTHAIEADPNDEAGAKSYASQRILQLNTAGSNSQGLSGTLRDLSGTNI